MGLRILLAEDHAIVREGLKAILEREGFDVIGEAADGREAVQQALRLEPEIALLDLSMPFKNGIEAASEILSALPATRAIILTAHSDRQYILQAFRSGVRGYILKTRAVAELKEAIHQVAKGRVYLSPDIPHDLIEPYRSRNQDPEQIKP
ncbi:MAG: response regulator transcription factor [Acidobacteriia bacterium]|nr:response regulator transcription factor [Terriglobia bacterium]